jgi:outer membrane protein OmpA-like peptidoglycan-associated protein
MYFKTFMKTYLLGTILLILSTSSISHAQHAKELPPGYYVVVAVFSSDHEDYATKFVNTLAGKNIKGSYGFNSERKFFYVFVKSSPDRNACVEEMYNMRKLEGFEKTWLRKIPEGQDPTEPAKEEKVVEVVEEVKPEPAVIEPAIEPPAEEKTVSLDELIVDTVRVEAIPTDIFVSTFNAANNREVAGKIKIVDTEKAKLIKEQDANDFLDIDPKRKPGQLTIICEAFGYRKVQQEINYPFILADTAKPNIDLVGPTFILYFDLVRYNKGDIATLYQVYFFNDAAIMLPESRFELNSLLQMMQENPSYKIRLHGHTNGNYQGRIILLGENKNFFSLEGSRNATGSAKELSEARADIIKEWLISNGIDPSRVEVKAWGGKRPIFDKNSANAKKNVRVEVEILEDKQI